MRKQGFVRRAAMAATSIAVATSVGLAGAGVASAAAPAIKIKPGAIWTLEEKEFSACEQDVFSPDGTFAATDDHFPGDAGTWTGGKSTISMTFTAGFDKGVSFIGSFDSAKGFYTGFIVTDREDKAKLVEGARPVTPC